MKKNAVFPGSFDPITLGHVDIVRRGLEVFDNIIIAIGVNSEKKYLFDTGQRISLIRAVFGNTKGIEIDTYSGLTVDYCRERGINFILRGLRNPSDFEFEKSIAQMNRKLSGVETVFLLTSPDISFISSSLVRELYRYGADISGLVPTAAADFIKKF